VKDGNDSNVVIPGRREAANPESIRRSTGVMDSGLAYFVRAPE
jgi:hypothetical protein